jgi:GMP synthase-like glutamine amidotransferase
MKAKTPKITTDPKGGVLFVKNCSIEGPGLFEQILNSRQIPYGIVDLEAGQELPPLKNLKAVVVLGGPASANGDSPAIQAELAFLRGLLEAEVPVLGICLGLQLLVKAAGGQVTIHAIRETGVIAPDRHPYTMALTAAGRIDELFEGVGEVFPPLKAGATSVLPVFQLHGETVQLPTDPAFPSKLLATGLFCTNQAVRIGKNAWGIQGHVEITPELLKDWMHADAILREHDRIGLLRDLGYLSADYRKAADLLFGNFLAIAGLAKSPERTAAAKAANDQ